MFGISRRKATKHTIEAIRPLIATYQSFHGLPAGFWRDEFVLGFVGFLISFHANVTSGYKLSQSDKGFLLYDVLTSLSNMNGKVIAQDYSRLAVESPKQEDFETGADYAAVLALYSIGKMNEKSPPLIEQATKLAGSSEHPEILAALMNLLFYQPLVKRFAGEL